MVSNGVWWIFFSLVFGTAAQSLSNGQLPSGQGKNLHQFTESVGEKKIHPCGHPAGSEFRDAAPRERLINSGAAGARFYFSFDFFGVLFFIFFSRPSSSSPSPSPLISILFFPLTKRFIHQAVERRFASFDAYLCDLIDSLSFIVSAGFPRSRQTSGVVLFSFFFARARDFLLPPQVLFPTRITDDETLLFGAHFFCSSKKT